MANIQYKAINFTLNGKEVTASIDMRESLANVLRNEFGMTSVKKGCEVGECGACTVLINGNPYDSCIFLAVWIDGKEVTTLEGLMDDEGNISDIQQAFIDESAIQCGFARRASLCRLSISCVRANATPVMKSAGSCPVICAAVPATRILSTQLRIPWKNAWRKKKQISDQDISDDKKAGPLTRFFYDLSLSY